MLNLGRLIRLVTALFLPLLLIGGLTYVFVLQGVADFICGAVDEVAFRITLTLVMIAAGWVSGVVGGLLLGDEL